MEEYHRSLLFDVTNVEVVDSPTLVEEDYTAKVICAKATTCYYQPTCKHGVPHLHLSACIRAWSNRLHFTPGMWSDSYDQTASYSHRPYICSNCISLPETKVVKKRRKIKLRNTSRQVICPATIDSCIGRCVHAVPHTEGKFCEDLYNSTGRKMRCCSVNSRRSILLTQETLSCHK